MNIKYQLARIENVEQLTNLRVMMQSELHGFSENQVTEEYKESVRSYFREAITNRKYISIVARDDLQIVGTAGFCLYQKPPSIIGGSGLAGYVTNVFTLNEYRRRGIGGLMMTELNKLAFKMNLDKLHLGATPDGVSIYKAVGYREPKYLNLEIRNQNWSL